MMDVGEQAWKSAAKKVMEVYVQRTHGTYIEQKGCALIWQFRDADPEFGFLQSKELEEHLKHVLEGYGVDILRGGGVSDGYIEARPFGMSKGLFLNHAIQLMKSFQKVPDFILAIGDDSSDEPMFDEISRITSGGAKDDWSSTGSGLSAFSVTVGKKPTSAASYVDDTSNVLELLEAMNRVSKGTKQWASALDLQSVSPSPINFNNVHRPGFNPQGISSTISTPISNSLKLGGRALSTNNLANPMYFTSPKRNADDGCMIDTITEDSKQPSMTRIASVAHISMSNYIDGLDGSNDNDEDAAIFF